MGINVVLGAETTEKIENPNIWLSEMEAGFPLNNRPKRAENTPGCHHAPNFHRSPDVSHLEENISLTFTFFYLLIMTLIEHFRFLAIQKELY